mmetsp:Transcript_26892/g.64164  ORF Transcript_26892/g.64164 Transcript_26892/m.64164 type:complete len:100 (+) Transcript_26892:936-1235(+)
MFVSMMVSYDTSTMASVTSCVQTKKDPPSSLTWSKSTSPSLDVRVLDQVGDEEGEGGYDTLRYDTIRSKRNVGVDFDVVTQSQPVRLSWVCAFSQHRFF